MVRLMQSYLGSSPQRTLIIVPPPPRPSPPPGKCVISTLPDELLAQILDHLAPTNPYRYHPDYADCLQIPIVCERWRRLYEPILYRRIDLGDSSQRESHCTASLLKIFEERSSIAGHVRDICVNILPPSRNDTCRAVAHVVQCCKSLRELSLHMEMPPAVWPIIHAASKIPRLERLRLINFEYGPALQMTLAHFVMPSLKELELRGYGLSFNNKPGARWHHVAQSTFPDLDHIFSKHFYNGAVTALNLTDPSVPPGVTKRLLQWPAHLARLSIRSLTCSPYVELYTVDAMQQLLDTQRRSLQHVVVGMIHGETKGIPNFSHFQHLQTLQLSKHNLLAETPYEAALKLSSPLLRHLSISSCNEDQHEAIRNVFATDQIRWLEDFASHITAKGTASNRLDTIFVIFYPGVILGDFDEVEDQTWPWEYLEQAVQALSRYNVTLTYTEPFYTKQMWNDILNKRRERLNAFNDPERIESYTTMGAMTAIRRSRW